MAGSFFIETLGCPKNAVDSDKIHGSLAAAGYTVSATAEDADLVVVNTCAFIEAAREESIETILDLAARRRDGARLVVTGCLAARVGAELAEALPEVDVVTDVGVPVQLTAGPRWRPAPLDGPPPALDLLDVARPAPESPWAYVKIAEGCDRRCGFCAIPSFRGPQRSRTVAAILNEVDDLVTGGVAEVVLVAQDLASFARDRPSEGDLVGLVAEVAARVERVRLLYLYPSSLTDRLIEAIVGTGVPYFDLSLQHASGRLLRAMRRYGNAQRFLERIGSIREASPEATLRSSFILGYPGETEADHDELLEFLEVSQLDWAGFFTFSDEEGTFAHDLPDRVPGSLALERLHEASETQEEITRRRRRELVGSNGQVLVDRPGVGRSHREAPEIDGVVLLDPPGQAGTIVDVTYVDAVGTDLIAKARSRSPRSVDERLQLGVSE